MLRALTSLRTTTLLLLIIAGVLASITLVEARVGSPPAGSTFHLYGSWWLFAMYAALFVHLLACLASRTRRPGPTLIVSHVGVALLLLGAFLTARGAQRGMVYLAEGEYTNVMQTPGRLRVEVARDGEVVRRVALNRVERASPGVPYQIDGVGTARLVRFLSACRIRNVLRPRDDALGVPGVHLDVVTPHGTHELVLAKGWAEDADLGGMRIVLGDGKGYASESPSLTVRAAQGDSSCALSLPADVGRTLHMKGITLAVLAYTPDFKVGSAPAGGPAINPALRVMLAAPGAAAETLWVFSRFQGFARPRNPSVNAIEFVMPESTGETLSLWYEGAWRFRYSSTDHASEGAFAEGDTFFVSPSPSMRVPLVVRSLLAQAEVVPEVQPAPEGSSAPSAVQLAIEGFDEPLWLIEEGPEVVMPGSDGEPRALSLSGSDTLPFWIALDRARREDYPNSSIPRIYESTVRIGDVADSLGIPLLVRTNRPAHYRGWRIYQAEFGQDGGSAWSGFQVAHDPGALPAFVGVIMLTGGLLFDWWRIRIRRYASVGAVASAWLVAATPVGAAPAGLPLADLVVSEGGRLKPLETLARDTEIEFDAAFPGGALSGFVALALTPDSMVDEPVLEVDAARASALGLSTNGRASINDMLRLREELERRASPRTGGLPEKARATLNVADRLRALEDLIALAPGSGDDGWWAPPTQTGCPEWARTRWAALRAHYRAGRIAEATDEAKALVREQRDRLGPLLPSRMRIGLEIWWRRANLPAHAPWLVAAAFLAYLVIVIGGATRDSLLLVPIGAVVVLYAVSVGSWIVFAGRLPLLNSWEVYFLVLLLVPLLAFIVHRKTGLHVVSGAALFLTLIGSVGHRFLPATARIIRPPVAILQSPWREIHILSTMTSYALLFLAAGLCTVLVVKPLQTRMARLAHRVLVAGVLLLGTGIATGAAWAHEAWGRYWGWDPKEVWALVAWLVFTAALHARACGMGGRRGWAVLVVIGLGALLFTFLGVTFLLPGLHSYG